MAQDRPSDISSARPHKTPLIAWVMLPIILVAIVWLSVEAKNVLLSINSKMATASALAEKQRQEDAKQDLQD